MEKPKKKKISNASNYNRLHGAPHGSTLKSSVSSPAFPLSRHHVHFEENIGENGPNGVTASSSTSSGQEPFSGFDEQDSELQCVMRDYGLEAFRNIPATNTSSLPKSSDHNSEHNQRLASTGISLCGGVTNLLISYPCIVLRRQCQVNHVGRKYHLTPFTIFSVALNLQRAQGVTCLWKGVGSSILLMGFTTATECGISELSSGKCSRDITLNSTFSSFCYHLALKGVTSLLMTPFYLAHLEESVQFFSKIPKIFVAHLRICGGTQFGNHCSRYCWMSRYILSFVLRQMILSIIRWNARRRHEERLKRLQPSSSVFQKNSEHMPSRIPASPLAVEDVSSKLLSNVHYPDIFASFVAELITDVVLYPIETVCNRINIQGTRTIIDNTDTGRGFLPVSSKYEGFWDCMSVSITTEGILGLYRGFGALILQHSMKYAIVRTAKFTLELISGNI
ncbi:mitochondrial outer membrane protein SLC25A46-like isoform X2 [Clavelina lepadiformis]|uniref:mitochondrial outer membrane protein SLC25A46-like isoform X2 n=1 Tax=Clavelina lepadiformis TaxID=159417 RepID=UPI004042198D